MTDFLPARRDLLGLGIAALALAGCGKRSDGSVLRVASQRGGTKAMLTAAGVLDRSALRIEWSEFAAAQPLLEALGAGAVDLGAVGDAPFLFAYQNGAPIRAVRAVRYEPHTVALAILVPAGSGIARPADLRGKRIATGRGSVGHLLLLRVLAAAGLRPDQAQISFLAPGDAKTALGSGSIDAWSTWNPYVAAAVLHDRARVLVDGRDIAPGYGFTAANADAIGPKRAQIAEFLKLQRAAQDWATRNIDAFAAVLAQETGLPLDVARATVDRRLIDVRTTPAVIAEQQRVLDDFVKAGAAMPRRPLIPAYDLSFEAPLPTTPDI